MNYSQQNQIIIRTIKLFSTQSNCSQINKVIDKRIKLFTKLKSIYLQTLINNKFGTATNTNMQKYLIQIY